MTKKALDLVAAAKGEIDNLSVEQVKQELSSGNAVLIDLREAQELADNGTIPGSVHVPRGVLEFTADPSLPIHKDFFQQDRRLILHCAVGGRSALGAKTLKDMGYTNIAHLESGFKGWQEAGEAIERAP